MCDAGQEECVEEGELQSEHKPPRKPNTVRFPNSATLSALFPDRPNSSRSSSAKSDKLEPRSLPAPRTLVSTRHAVLTHFSHPRRPPCSARQSQSLSQTRRLARTPSPPSGQLWPVVITRRSSLTTRGPETCVPGRSGRLSPIPPFFI